MSLFDLVHNYFFFLFATWLMTRLVSSDGLLCHQSGTLIAKPCTTQEVEFYESSVYHPKFRAFMPQWFGTLSSGDTQQQQISLAAAQQQGAIAVQSQESSSTSAPQSATQTPATPASDEASWTPSGGKKLETGISIVLENVADGFKRPNVLDIKLGARLWADDAPPAKRAKLDAVSKETTSSTLGFRIAGMKVWVGDGAAEPTEFTNPYLTRHEGCERPQGEVVEKNGYRRYDKWYGRTFTADNVKEGLRTFLAGAKMGKVDRSKLIASRLVEELRAVQHVLETEESRMYSSSVLIIYEGDPDALEAALEEEKKRKERKQEQASKDEEEEEEEEEEDDGIPIPGLTPGGTLSTGDGNGPVNIQIDPQTIGEIGDIEDDDDDDEPVIKVHDLRLIDFAHARWTPGQGPDENVLMGVRNLLRIMEELSRDG